MIRPRKIALYNAYKRRFHELGFKEYRLAKELGILSTTVYAFFACRLNKISKRNFHLIHRWLVEHDIIIVKRRPRHDCPDCGKTHVIKNPIPLVAHVRNLVQRIISMSEEINHSSDPKLKMHLDDLVQELVKAMREKESVQARHTQNAERDVESPVRTSERTE